MQPHSKEVEDALQAQITQQRLDILEKAVADLTKDRDKAMRWGILALGGAVITMATAIVKFIFTNIGNFK